MSLKAVVQKLGTSVRRGLSRAEVDESREKFGPNYVPETPTRSGFQIFVEQFKSLPVALLIGASVLSLTTGGLLDACVVMAVVCVNAVIGFVTEREAERTIHSLKQLVSASAQVVRDGILHEVIADDVVVGDILLLRPGTRVAADARVIHAHELTVDESVLTGESMPVRKVKEALRKTDIVLADRLNMVYSGTLVVGGAGTAVVVAVGGSSEIGKIKLLVAETETPPTLIEKQLERLGNKLVLVSGALCILFFLVGFLHGRDFIEMLKTSIALAVAAVPEGLTAVATTTLALGIKRLRQDKVIIRNLDAICTLGSVQTICFDKTGTITYNRMSVTLISCGDMRVHVEDGILVEDGHPVDLFSADQLMMTVRVSILCNESKIEHHDGGYIVSGSPTENALIHMATHSGINVVALREQYPLMKVQYRSENRNFMETMHVWDDSKTLFAVKGNPVEVLSMCSHHLSEGQLVPFLDEERDAIEFQNDNMAGEGLRVLGIAYRICEPDRELKGDQDLVWLGLMGMADPIREQAKQSIREFHRAGLETVMITGDQAATAYAVGKELGLSNGNALEVLDSRDLSSIDPALVKALGSHVHVFSRVSPANKLQIVQALQKNGRVVAMTGDGINDGPALKAADVGIAMGASGTDVAREVADAVLESDDLETLVIAMRDGRSIVKNVRKTLHYLLSTNLSEIQVMLMSGVFGLGHPLNTMQLLWINLVSDIFPGLALAVEPPDPDIMDQPPRDPTEPIVDSDEFKKIAFEGGLLAASSMGAYLYGISRYGMGATASTLAFQSLTTGQILHALSCRSEQSGILSAHHSQPNQYLNLAVISSLVLQSMTFLIPGLRGILGLSPLSIVDGLVVGAASLVPLVINESRKEFSTAGTHA
jgi:Ca2+-transporting ATPase